MTDPNELAAYVMSDNECDGCRDGFAPREHAVGARGHLLDGRLVRLFELYMPGHPNSDYLAVYHWDCGYAIMEIDHEMG